LVKAASRRMDNDIDLSDLAREVMESGRQYMCLASDLMSPQQIPTEALPEVAPYA